MRVGRGAGRAPGRLGRGVLTAAKRAQALLKMPGRQRWKRSPARPRTPPPGGRPAESRAHARGRARASGLRAPSVRPRTRAHPDGRHGLQTDPTDHTRTYGPRTLCRTRARLGRAHVAQLTQAQTRETKLRGPRSGKRLSVRRRGVEVARAPGAPEMQATAASSARKVLTCVAPCDDPRSCPRYVS